MYKQKIVIKLGVSNAKTRSKAMQLASKFHGVSSVGITGDGKDRLEVVGEGVDAACLVNCLRKKVCSADIVLVGEVKDKIKEEKKPEDLPPYPWWPGYYWPPPPPPMVVCDEQVNSCHVM